MTTWFTGDLHFWHKNIIKHCNRPFSVNPQEPTKVDVETMNAALIRNWNRVVGDDDTVYNLGDLACCCSTVQALDCLRQLNGQQFFLRGNHDGWIDELRPRDVLGSGALSRIRFQESLIEVTVEGQLIVLCHYPLRSWRGCQKGSWHLYGHVHGLLAPFGKSTDVGVDAVRPVIQAAEDAAALPTAVYSPVTLSKCYRPVSFDEVKAYMNKRPVGPHEPFGDCAPSKEATV